MSVAARSRSSETRIRSPETRAKIAYALCGRTLTAETRLKVAVARRGQKASAETRAKLSSSLKRRFADPAERAKLRARRLGYKHSARTKAAIAKSLALWIALWPKPETSLERALYALLNQAGYGFERQKRFGHYVVDAFIPSRNIVFEADGRYWHQDKEHEERRDRYLIGRSVVAVVHLDEEDLI